MRGIRASARRTPGALFLAAALGAALSACDGNGGNGIGPIVEPSPPEDVAARYRWVLHGWEAGGLDPVGHAAVEVAWELPQTWNGEPFRVYARSSGSASFVPIATVTSCAEGLCRYLDLDVAPGTTYDYFVATVGEREGDEAESAQVSVAVPVGAAPETPAAPTATALDGALYLQWPSTGAERYRVFLEAIDSDSVFIEIGETDGTSLLDERAENGVVYSYRIAAIDTLGQFSSRSALGAGVPRPDYHAEIIYAHADVPAESGFRFRSSGDQSPIVSGTAPDAQWRLETINGVLSVRPLNGTEVTAGVFTTALTCGPGSDPDCVSIQTAPAASAFAPTPVAVEAANTYVFLVTGDDGELHYGKLRVQGQTTDTNGDTLIIFDWAYQLLPEVPNLNVGVR